MPLSRGQLADTKALSKQARELGVTRLRRDFPILALRTNGKRLVYLDNASTTQKPRTMINRIRNFYSGEFAKIDSDTYTLGREATESYEEVRAKIKRFINAGDVKQISFVLGATEAINAVATGFERGVLKKGDEVLVTTMEHNANIAPWLTACKQTGATLKVVPISRYGDLDLDRLEEMLTGRTRIVSVAHVSNVFGTINPVKKIVRMAHDRDIPVLLDGAQAVPHMPVDVQDIGCDFYAFSSHKMYGPTGVGILYGRKEWLETIPPHQGGSPNVKSINFEEWKPEGLPRKFESGIPAIAETVGLGAAVDYLAGIGMDKVALYEEELAAHAFERLSNIKGVTMVGEPQESISVISFTVEGAKPEEVSKYLDEKAGIATRAGRLSAQPLFDFLGIPGAVRASFGLYNTRREADLLADMVEQYVKSRRG